jgi:hypothetical protein
MVGNKKMKTIFSRRARRGRKRRRKYGIHVPGLRIQAPDFWFPIPDPRLLDPALPPVFSGNGRKGPPARSIQYLVFFGRSKENLEEAVQEETKITPQREGDETLGHELRFHPLPGKGLLSGCLPGRNYPGPMPVLVISHPPGGNDLFDTGFRPEWK